jgi:two-component system chemotaxis sensor kinase CheA
MDKDQENFLNELLNDFKIEAAEHLQAIIDGLIMLEKNKDIFSQKTAIENIFREVHSLKGAASAVNLSDIEKLCMGMEDVFNNLKKGNSRLIPPLFDAFYKATDLLKLLLNDLNNNVKKGSYNLMQILKNMEFAHKNSIIPQQEKNSEENQITPIRIKNEDFAENNSIEIEKTETDNTENKEGLINNQNSVNEISKTVRISTEKLNKLLQQSEELITIKTTFDFFTKELQNINYQHNLWNKNVYKDAESIIKSTTEDIKDFLSTINSFNKKHQDDLLKLTKNMLQFQHISGRMIDELLYGIKTALLFPFSSMLNIFPKLVRDLSKEYSKDIEIKIIGDSIEIDRRILEELKDPLIHLIRNSIDHGIENVNERIAKGKLPKGIIEIKIVQNIDRKIELQIRDDGGGIDKTKIINSALKMGIYKQNEIEKLSDNEIHSLIFSSGISTSPFITTISGRGLGMAIVAEKVNKLGGSIDLQTIKDQGTTFIITLPQTLATFRGVMINTADQHFIIPSFAVEKVLRIKNTDIKTVESHKTLCYNGETLGLSVLSDVLKISKAIIKTKESDYFQVLLLNSSQKKIAFIVDQILGEQEGIVKDLGTQLSYVRNIAGATILGSGKVVPILHPAELIETASNTNYSFEKIYESSSSTEEFVNQKNILVAEDSITIRTLLRNFIENAGFNVKTAVDGMEAYDFFLNEHFDLVVSDVEMPRMNGFELTAKIREDKKHSDLPIILVTALETADDKQRGMEVGANAYIVKSSFEKSNLIDTIQRLI